MKHTSIEIIIVILITGILSISIFYFNPFFSSVKKDYGNETLNALYAGHEDRVRMLDKPFVIRKFNLKNKNLFSTSPTEADIEIIAIAYYNTTVKVISKLSYANGLNFPWDDISPYDLFFRWGELAKPEYDNSLNLITYHTALSRTAYFKLRGNETELYEKYRSYQSNTHAVILNEDIKNLVDKIKPKDIVHFEGYLVKIISQSKGFENSTWGGETDITNAGIDLWSSCEVFYIMEVT